MLQCMCNLSVVYDTPTALQSPLHHILAYVCVWVCVSSLSSSTSSYVSVSCSNHKHIITHRHARLHTVAHTHTYTHIYSPSVTQTHTHTFGLTFVSVCALLWAHNLNLAFAFSHTTSPFFSLPLLRTNYAFAYSLILCIADKNIGIL